MPIIRIGDYSNSAHGVEFHLLNTTVEFAPEISGPIMLFVNDAIGPLPWWDYFYTNNHGGSGQVEIAKVTNAVAGASASAARRWVRRRGCAASARQPSHLSHERKLAVRQGFEPWVGL